MRIRALPASLLLCSAVAFSGCGIITKDLEGNVRFSFSIDDEDDRYEDIVEFDPDSNQDVRENRDRIEEGNILSISINIVEIKTGNAARQVAGQVDVRAAGEGDDAWLMAVGQWSGIALYEDEAGDVPVSNTVFKLDLPISTQDELSNKVFLQRNKLDFRINGYGYDNYHQPLGPVRLEGEVDVALSVKVSAP